jgi:hypothetical protein
MEKLPYIKEKNWKQILESLKNIKRGTQKR